MLSLRQIKRPATEMDEDWNESSQTIRRLTVKQVEWVIVIHSTNCQVYSFQSCQTIKVMYNGKTYINEAHSDEPFPRSCTQYFG